MNAQAKEGRRANQAKAMRLVKNDPHQKVDASSWKPNEALNADRKTGARPVRARIYKLGGKIQGDRADRHPGRAARASGGKVGTGPLSMANVPEENKRDFGSYHEGGYKRGGAPKAGQDMADMKKAMRRADGGKAESRRINDSLEDHGTDLEREKVMSRSRRPPISPPMIKSKTEPNYPAERDLERGDYDAAPPMSSPSGRGPESGFKKGGKPKRRAKGGRAKGKTNINIVISQPKPDQSMQPPQGVVRPPPPPPPPPQMPPPAAGGSPGAGAMPGGPPGGMPPPGPMPHKRGGKVYRSAKDMDAGSDGGLGRLEKAEIQEHRR